MDNHCTTLATHHKAGWSDEQCSGNNKPAIYLRSLAHNSLLGAFPPFWCEKGYWKEPLKEADLSTPIQGLLGEREVTLALTKQQQVPSWRIQKQP